MGVTEDPTDELEVTPPKTWAAGVPGVVHPETNVLVPLDSVADISNTPTSKGIVVRLEPFDAGAPVRGANTSAAADPAGSAGTAG
jgi:hypothetical protein